MPKNNFNRSINRTLIIVFCLLFFNGLIFSQMIPKDSFEYKLNQILYDTGQDWKLLSFFNDIQFETIYLEEDKQEKKNSFNSNYFIQTINNKLSFGFFSHFRFKKKYYGYLYSKIGNQNTTFHLYRDSKDKGLNDENIINVESSGLGYQNNWVNLKIGKGKESWGAGENIELALSNSADPFDFFELRSNYGNIRVKYIHGFLESTPNRINRYITARGFEWSNEESFIIGFSEIIIYSGLNRSLDIGYLNPMSSHLEVELNNRLNIIGNGSSNAVWQIHSDFLIKKKLRLSVNYLYDEFVLDPDIEVGKEHGKAYSFRIAQTFKNTEKSILILYGQTIYVGTPTFRHSNGYNNFVNNGRPLGWSSGSDSRDFSFGLNFSNKKTFLFLLNTGVTFSGDENIKYRYFESYLDYQKGTFPSGEIKKNMFLTSNFVWWLNKNLELSMFSYISNKKIHRVGIGIKFSIQSLLNLKYN